MIKIEQYFINKPETYLCLLNFARLSKGADNPLYAAEDILTALNSLAAPDRSIASSLTQIYPLLYHNTIRSNLQDQISPKTLSHLKSSTYRLVVADVIQRQWLSRILLKFQENGIPVILLKGAAFSDLLYPNYAPRLGVDIDLLVKKNDFDAACVLSGEIMEAVAPDSTRMATYSTLFERVFSAQKNGGPIVEIHRGLTNPHLFKIEEKDLWEASRKHPAFEFNHIRILSPEDTLLHLAVHAFRDLDFGAHNTLDAHEVWCQWKPDADTLFLHANQWGAKKVLFYLLLNCKMIMQTPIPETLIEKLKPSSTINALNKKILRSDTSQKLTNRPVQRRIIQLISQILCPDHSWNGLRHQISYGYTRMRDWLISLKKK